MREFSAWVERLRERGALLLIVAIAATLAGCETLGGALSGLQRPSVESVVPRITGIDFQGVNLAFDVGVKNPYGVPLVSPKFDYRIAIAQTQLMQASQTTSLNLPARAVGNVTLPVRMGYADLWRVAQQFKDAAEVPYTLEGNLHLDALGQALALPVKTTGKVPVLRMPSFSQIEMEQPEIGMSEAGVALNMAVNNPNVFSIGLENLGYALRLGDIDVGSIAADSPRALAAGQNGRVRLTGRISGMALVGRLLGGGQLGMPTINALGSLQTPYGSVRTPD